MSNDETQDIFVNDGGHGGGAPVVFLHSLAGTSDHWAAQLAHLRRSRRALALDLPGHGRSAAVGARARAAGDFRIETLAAQVAPALDRLDLGRFVLAGHSLGAAIAVSHAASHPDQVAGLFLVDPAGDGRLVPPEAAEGMMAALRSHGYQAAIEQYWGSLITESRPEVRERLLRDLRATAPELVAGVLEALLTFDPVTPLRAYRGPRLSVITHHNETPSALHALVPDVPARKVAGTGHWVQLDDPDAVNRLLDEFLAQL